MEEKIFEILTNKLFALIDLDEPEVRGQKDASKEITDHFKEFIEWLVFDNERFYSNDDGQGRRIWLDMENDHLLPPSKYERTLDEVYQYWIDNIMK